MNLPRFVLFFVLLLPCLSLAGEIYGSVKEGKSNVGQGIKIEIVSAGRVDSTRTDRLSSFRLFIPKPGKCTLRVHYQSQTPSLVIYSYETPVRYDLVLEKTGEKYSLRRK